jgi:serine/threonine protein kinase
MGDSPASTERQRRARSIFQAALALPEIQRASYVANVCRGELELRREVERMLDLDRNRTGETRRPSDAGAPPERVNNYDVVSKIGEGGMGAVFLCKHHFFDRNAALKVLHPHLCSDETLVSRFLNEARAANAIRHVNIIEVIDAGLMTESGAPYLLMEHLSGENLGERLRRVGRMDVAESLQILGQTASALAAAHDQGIVHRDLKPENLFLVPRIDGGDQVKVLDFGIAKLRPDIGGKFVKTQPGAVVGTPAYMSPEQCMGNGAIDHRTDIYSLGVILFEMLSGRPPYEAEGMGGLLAAHILNEPPLLGSLVPDLPRYVEEAVQKALRKKPDERFQSMRELRASLGELAVPRPLPQSAAQMAAQTLSPQPGSFAPGSTPPPRAAVKHPTPPVQGQTFPPSATDVAPAPSHAEHDHSTLNSTATELGAQPQGPRRLLLVAAATAVLALGGAVWFYGRGPGATAPAMVVGDTNDRAGAAESPPSSATASKTSKTTPTTATTPAEAAPLTVPVTPPAKAQVPSTVAPAAREAATGGTIVTPVTGAKPPTPVVPRARTKANTKANTGDSPRTPGQPKEFEPPLW